MSIVADEVDRVFRDCLYTDRELTESAEMPPADAVIAEGVVCTVGFHPARLESHRDAVLVWLDHLGDEYRASGGGGWTFLNLCNDREGYQWTGLHQRMEQLCQLAIGLGLGEWQLPREVWSALPGGMPYFVIKDVHPLSHPSGDMGDDVSDRAGH